MNVDFSAEREALRAEAACFDPAAEPFASMTIDDLFYLVGRAYEDGETAMMARGYLELWFRLPATAQRLELATALLAGMGMQEYPALADWASENPNGISHQISFGIRAALDEAPPLPDDMPLAEVIALAESQADAFIASMQRSALARKIVEKTQAEADAFRLN